MKKLLFSLLLLTLFFNLYGVEVSGGVGSEGVRGTVFFLNGNWGFLPFISTELEYSSNFSTGFKYYMLGFQGKLKLNLISPFIRAGISYGGYDISLSSAKFYRYIGGGVSIYLIPIMGVKGGVVQFKGKVENFTRIYGGIFVNI